ncbi:unnamed protein product [Staurois parvus]|uniref:Secreted protein n=1 Tax=Staurois parvus TaxID=386267 RepID=A0ABN9H7A2_9NEOB|nr:unnamed protein product [Staurois parvus]
MQNPLTSVWTVLIGPVLITCTLPRKKKTSLAIHTKLSMCRVTPRDMSYQEIRRGHLNKRRDRENRIKWPFYTMQRINPLGSTVSTSSMLYCIYRLILLVWV